MNQTFEKYPAWIVLVSNSLSILVYGLGFFILFQTHWILSAVYLAFALFLEIRIIKSHCVDCYYWGKTCGFGKGQVSAWLFKKGDSVRFCAMNLTWKSMIPDLMVSFIPVITAIILLIIDFNLLILFALISIFALTTAGNGFVRGSLTCKFCKQRELGCPAEKLFNK